MCLILALSAVLGFGGCTVGPASDASGSDSKAGKDLTVVSFTDLYMDKDGTDYNDAKKAYESKYGGSVAFKRYPANMFINKMITLIGSGKSPDLAYCRWAEMPKLAAMDILQPVDGYIQASETNYPKIADSYVFGNKHYAARIEQVQPYVIWYNRDILRSCGCDDPYTLWKNDPASWDWDAFEAIAVATTEDRNHDGETDLWGFAGLPFFGASNGASSLRIEGDKVTISWKEQAYLDSLTFMQKLRFTLGVACPDNNYGATNFKNGDVAMTMGTFEFVWASASQMDQESIGCAPLPAGPNFEADGSRYSCMTNLLGIVNGSKNPNGAAEFCRIMNQNDKTKYPDGTPIGNPEAEKYLSAEHKEVLRFVRDNAYVVMTDGWGSWGEQDGNSLWVNLFWDNKDIVKTLDSLQPIYQAQIDETLSFSMPEVEEFKGAPTVTFENGDMAYLTFDGTVSKDQGITDEADRVIDGKSSLVFSSDTKDALLLRSSASKLKIPSYRTYKLSFDWQIISAQDAVNGCDFYATFRSEAEVNSADRQTGALSVGGVAGDFGTAEATVTLSANIKDYVVAFVAGLNGGTVAIDNVSLVEVE